MLLAEEGPMSQIPESMEKAGKEEFLADFYQSFETALLNVTELGREDRSEAWLGVMRSAIVFIQTHQLPTHQFQYNLQSC